MERTVDYVHNMILTRMGSRKARKRAHGDRCQVTATEQPSVSKSPSQHRPSRNRSQTHGFDKVSSLNLTDRNVRCSNPTFLIGRVQETPQPHLDIYRHIRKE
jgi:hypothetical protein